MCVCVCVSGGGGHNYKDLDTQCHYVNLNLSSLRNANRYIILCIYFVMYISMTIPNNSFLYSYGISQNKVPVPYS